MMEQNRGKKELTGDQGQKAKQLGDLVARVKGMIEGLPILITGISHVYMSQEEYGPRHKITGGLKPLFMAHAAFMMSKTDLTNEKVPLHLIHLQQSGTTDDKKRVIGIRSRVQILKSRSSKPGETVDLEAVYGCNYEKYSGLWELFIDRDLVTSPSQGWYQFTRSDGTVKKFQRKDFVKYIEELMSLPLPGRLKAAPSVVLEFEDDGTGIPDEAVQGEVVDE
jgi:hypothetical protein